MACRRCGHRYLDPRPSPSDLDVIYPSTYYTLAGTDGIVARMQRRWERGKVETWRRAMGPGPKRILDVGCGDGRILQVLRDFGPAEWELAGVDFDAEAVEKCRQRGFTAYRKRVEELGEAEGGFDAILMLQLIEHVEDPVAIARKVFSLLRPGGVFVVETPNLAGLDYRLFKGRWWGHYHFPRHWNLFTTESLHRMLEAQGFSILRTDQLISTSAWTISLHNYFLDRDWPAPVVRFMSYRNPLLLALFVTLDAVRARLGLRTSNQRVIAQKPLGG